MMRYQPHHYQKSANQVRLPRGYLEKGYLDDRGNIYPELINEHAEALAQEIRDIAPSQFRRFFNHARGIEARVRQELDFESVRHELDKMRPFVMAALADRNAKMSAAFAEMIRLMVSAVRTRDDFLKGFMPHFESVLAYFTYYNSVRGGSRR